MHAQKMRHGASQLIFHVAYHGLSGDKIPRRDACTENETWSKSANFPCGIPRVIR